MINDCHGTKPIIPDAISGYHSARQKRKTDFNRIYLMVLAEMGISKPTLNKKNMSDDKIMLQKIALNDKILN